MNVYLATWAMVVGAILALSNAADRALVPAAKRSFGRSVLEFSLKRFSEVLASWTAVFLRLFDWLYVRGNPRSAQSFWRFGVIFLLSILVTAGANRQDVQGLKYIQAHADRLQLSEHGRDTLRSVIEKNSSAEALRDVVFQGTIFAITLLFGYYAISRLRACRSFRRSLRDRWYCWILLAISCVLFGLDWGQTLGTVLNNLHILVLLAVGAKLCRGRPRRVRPVGLLLSGVLVLGTLAFDLARHTFTAHSYFLVFLLIILYSLFVLPCRLSPARSIVSTLCAIALVLALSSRARAAFFGCFNDVPIGLPLLRLFPLLIVGVLSDSISLLETRAMLQLSSRGPALRVAGLLVADIVISALLILAVPMSSGDPVEILDAIAFRGNAAYIGMFFWAAFFASAVFYLFLLSCVGLVAFYLACRGLGLLRGVFQIERSPCVSIGLVSIALVSVGLVILALCGLAP